MRAMIKKLFGINLYVKENITRSINNRIHDEPIC